MVEFIQVITTSNKKQEAEDIAESLVAEKLAGCVQIFGPIKSVYRWKGRIEISEEWLCLIKSRRDLYQSLESFIKVKHSYETPEIIAIPVIEGSQNYLSWLGANISK